MSYRRQYVISVPYTCYYSYPASESGGSGSKSGTTQATIIIDVDTTPFDLSVANCNREVHGLTTAVVATNAAQVEAKRRTSQQISSTIVKGFFDYVGADLSQKVKELSSQCEAMFVALLGHKDNCLAKSNQMQNDYIRITKRYAKVFEDLDKEATSRIKELDRPVFQFAQMSQELMDRNCNSEQLGLATVAADENLKLETMLSCSHIKHQAANVIDKANAYLQGTYRLSDSIQNLLDTSDAVGEIMIPAMFVESTAVQGKVDRKVFVTETDLVPGKEISSKLSEDFTSENIAWGDMSADEYEKVISYFNANIQSANLDDRTVKTMLALFRRQAIQTIKG